MFLLTLWLFVAVVQNYICGVVHSSCHILNGTFAKFIHSEDIVIDVGDTVDIVLKHVNAEGLMEFCAEIENTCYGCFSRNIQSMLKYTVLIFPPNKKKK